MAERQAFGIDINEYSRTGGINYDLVKTDIQTGVYDFIIIKAGLGKTRSELLDEQKQQLNLHGIPNITYHLLDPREDMRAQAHSYVEWVGTQEPAYIVDIESPSAGVRVPNRGEVLSNIDELTHLIHQPPVVYSRMGILKDIGFVNDARNFRLWLANYPWDITQFPANKMEYVYFHDFTRDFAGRLPLDVLNTGLEGNVILWQFSEKGNGPYYIYNLLTKHPKFKVGMKQADLNISMKTRSEFMQSIWGQVETISDAQVPVDVESHEEVLLVEPTFPDFTNQQMIDLIYKAARPFTKDPWQNWIVRANMEFLAIPNENRVKPYTGPKIEDLPNLTQEEKAAILAAMNVPVGGNQAGGSPYPGVSNQRMINIIFKAAMPFTQDPWNDWIVRAHMEFLAVPTGSRIKPYTGPKVEDLPNLTQVEKAAIFQAM